MYRMYRDTTTRFTSVSISLRLRSTTIAPVHQWAAKAISTPLARHYSRLSSPPHLRRHPFLVGRANIVRLAHASHVRRTAVHHVSVASLVTLAVRVPVRCAGIAIRRRWLLRAPTTSTVPIRSPLLRHLQSGPQTIPNTLICT